ncbi:MAG: helical backbone metal receptor [Gemmatimonadota bacterium]|nr:helical backbone metal receptor [Gemmatimonadota bacterium]
MRIVSLCPSLTELVFDLGRGADLVGVTKFCVHPAGRVASIEKVGGTKNPKVERIVDLAPELVLLNEEENRAEDAEALAAAGLRCHASFPRTAEETAAMVRSIGAALDRAPQAEAIAADIESRAARVRAAAAGRPRVPYACLIWRKPWMAAGADTFIHALLALAGGENVFAGRVERYPEVSAGELAGADPAVVLLTSEPFPFGERHARELVRATALPRERFEFADGELLSWHGSRTPRGIDYAEALLDAVRA